MVMGSQLLSKPWIESTINNEFAINDDKINIHITGSHFCRRIPNSGDTLMSLK